jgi:hypothetical protein
VNSLIEGWRARPRFVTHRLPVSLAAPDLPDPQLWSFALFPGWPDVVSAPLEEICARQYVACNEAVLTAREGMDETRWLDVAYEDLVASPEAEIRRLFESLDVAFAPEVAAFAETLDRRVSATALTPPKAGKWREQNAEAVARVLPLVAETERRLGYDVAESAA